MRGSKRHRPPVPIYVGKAEAGAVSDGFDPAPRGCHQAAGPYQRSCPIDTAGDRKPSCGRLPSVRSPHG